MHTPSSMWGSPRLSLPPSTSPLQLLKFILSTYCVSRLDLKRFWLCGDNFQTNKTPSHKRSTVGVNFQRGSGNQVGAQRA